MLTTFYFSSSISCRRWTRATHCTIALCLSFQCFNCYFSLMQAVYQTTSPAFGCEIVLNWSCGGSARDRATLFRRRRSDGVDAGSRPRRRPLLRGGADGPRAGRAASGDRGAGVRAARPLARRLRLQPVGLARRHRLLVLQRAAVRRRDRRPYGPTAAARQVPLCLSHYRNNRVHKYQ